MYAVKAGSMDHVQKKRMEREKKSTAQDRISFKFDLTVVLLPNRVEDLPLLSTNQSSSIHGWLYNKQTEPPMITK
jgi:hypothetical protein